MSETSEISIHSEIPQDRGPHIEYGKERHPIPYFERIRNGQEHRRNFASIEAKIAELGIPFSFREELKHIGQTFSESSELMILDGGCGVGIMLSEVETMEGEIGKQVHTVGVTLEDDPSVIEQLQGTDIDEVFIGGMNEFVERNGDRKYHFILDSSGYAYHDQQINSDGSFSQGENIIPLYSHMLVPGGRAFLTLGIGNEQFYGKKSRENLLNLLKRNNLAILEEVKEKGYYIVEKSKNREISEAYS